MESTKQIQSLFFFWNARPKNQILVCREEKSIKKPEFLTEQLERGNFINLISWISIMKWFSPDCKTARFWNTFSFARHTPSKLHILSKLQTCALPSPREKGKTLNNRLICSVQPSIWAYHLSSVQCECTKRVHLHRAHGKWVHPSSQCQRSLLSVAQMWLCVLDPNLCKLQPHGLSLTRGGRGEVSKRKRNTRIDKI